jgi:hypothetical protein
MVQDFCRSAVGTSRFPSILFFFISLVGNVYVTPQKATRWQLFFGTHLHPFPNVLSWHLMLVFELVGAIAFGGGY